MWSCRLSAVLSAVLWFTEAFVVPPSGTNTGHVRFRSQGDTAPKQPSTRSNSSGSRAAIKTALLPRQQQRRHTATAASMKPDTGGGCGRMAFLSEVTRAAAGAVVAGAAVTPKMAEAKEAAETPVDWSAEFVEVKKATDAVLSDLRGLTTKGEWVQLMEQAKGYDQSIRKGLMGEVRKKMPKDVKADAMTYRNNITFDLIAINKAARVEDKSRALEVLDILEADIRDFLNLEKRI